MKCERQLCIKLYFRRQLNGSDYTDDGSTDHDHDHDQHHHQDQDQGQDQGQDQDQDQVRWKGFLCRRFAALWITLSASSIHIFVTLHLINVAMPSWSVSTLNLKFIFILSQRSHVHWDANDDDCSIVNDSNYLILSAPKTQSPCFLQVSNSDCRIYCVT